MTSKTIAVTVIVDVSAMTRDERKHMDSAATLAGIYVTPMFDGNRVVLSAPNYDTIARFTDQFPKAVAQ